MRDEAPVFGEASVVAVGVGGEEPVDDHGQDRHRVLPDGGGQGRVQGGVFQRGEGPAEDGFGEGSEEVAAPGGDGGRPRLITQSCGPVALVQGVESGGEAVAEDDGPPSHGLGDGGVLAFGVAGNVDAPSERQRPRVEAFGEGGFAGADDAGDDEVGRGDDALLVQLPRVVHERAARVEVGADEHAVRAQSSFGEERVLARQHGRGVLMAGQAETARAAQHRGPGLAGLGQVAGGVAFGPLRLTTFPRGVLFGAALLGLQVRGGLAALLAQFALLVCGRDEDGGVQLLLAHSPSPRGVSDAGRRVGS